jgi:hypothetical protein
MFLITATGVLGALFGVTLAMLGSLFGGAYLAMRFFGPTPKE